MIEYTPEPCPDCSDSNVGYQQMNDNQFFCQCKNCENTWIEIIEVHMEIRARGIKSSDFAPKRYYCDGCGNEIMGDAAAKNDLYPNNIYCSAKCAGYQ